MFTPLFDVEIDIRRKPGQAEHPGHLKRAVESVAVEVVGGHSYDPLQAFEVLFGRGRSALWRPGILKEAGAIRGFGLRAADGLAHL